MRGVWRQSEPRPVRDEIRELLWGPYEQTDLKGDRQIPAASNNPEYDRTEMAFFFSFAARRATLISDP